MRIIKVENSSSKRFMGFRDPRTQKIDCFVLYRDEFCTKILEVKEEDSETRKIKTKKIQLKSREIDVPLLKQTFYAPGWHGDPLETVYSEIQTYIESLKEKNYSNENTFVTVAPLSEAREIVNEPSA